MPVQEGGFKFKEIDKDSRGETIDIDYSRKHQREVQKGVLAD